jgi:predicted esterase
MWQNLLLADLQTSIVAYSSAAVVVLLVVAGVVALRLSANRGLAQLVQADPHKGLGGSTLIVLVHGQVRTIEWVRTALERIRQARPDADILFLKYPSHPASNANAFEIADQMCGCIHGQFAAGQYENIILVGYSRGALLLRKAYVYGHGLIQDLETVPSQTRPQLPWVRAVKRVVLLAGMNRGWTLRRRLPSMSIAEWLWLRFMRRIARLTGTASLYGQCENGHPFVANLRIQWLDLMRSLQAAEPKPGAPKPDQPMPDERPVVIQLLGDRDDFVSSEDQADVKVARDFIWVKVSNSTHSGIMDFSDPLCGQERWHKFAEALGDEKAVARLKLLSTKPPDTQDPDVKVAVIVLHGIRDMAGWTSAFQRPLQDAFRRRHPAPDKLYVHRASYGFFGMLPFLLWADRQSNVRWFMDEFTEIKAAYPNLEAVHFIGHSNGTYVLASALKSYKTLKVGRIAFAGSVVRRDYNWDALVGRIGKIRNYVGSGDWVVGWFPRLFEMRPFSLLNPDIGSAGFDGFIRPLGNALEIKYVHGSHGAALAPNNISSIIDFIIDERETYPPPPLYPTERSNLMELSSHVCWIVWLALIALALGLGWSWNLAFDAWVLPSLPTALLSYGTTIATAAYVFVLWLVVNYL